MINATKVKKSKIYVFLGVLGIVLGCTWSVIKFYENNMNQPFDWFFAAWAVLIGFGYLFLGFRKHLSNKIET
ncbi:hypothetical protein R9C00_23355 [Flammeovirgaceae bacterium SG7u.111]|nr:hypothetical protein [Flammeovirgaceae bacterium SG7u.132]WPO34643.1 hypothetical protein R9C00_23355 [Flammeovirgaceae bacterium SG7u.111]